MFEEIKTGGMAAMMKYMNDPTFLSKIGEKVGDLDASLGGAGGVVPPPTQAMAEPPPVVVNNILDAAK